VPSRLPRPEPILGGSRLRFAETRRASAQRWQRFWGSGGAIDLSASRDARWKELERRIVLSQYLMAAQSAGSWPSPEIGLMGIDMWVGQFHMEMVWWHLAHYGLWDRWELADQALGCYQRFLPMARRLADLEYRLRPTQAVLDKWKEIVFETADYLADFPTLDAAMGRYHLTPIMPPCELGITEDTVFDLAYFRFGLDKAQEWRTRLGLPREARWDDVRARLAPLPEKDGLFVHCPGWRDETFTKRAWEHPDPLGVLGMLPPMDGVDRQTAHRTLKKVAATWDWDRCWGWDFPWAAMVAARLDEPALAVDMLLHPSEKNRYDQRGVCTGGPCPYLPGNGGLLYAVAMMASGWDGRPDRHAPGFPDDGTWVVRWEGLRKAP
jgi:hypothetical protein